MDMNRILQIAKRINLPTKDIESITEYLEHGEWGIAFEVLCSAIEYDKIPILIVHYTEIEQIGKYMEMDKELWEVFKI